MEYPSDHLIDGETGAPLLFPTDQVLLLCVMPRLKAEDLVKRFRAEGLKPKLLESNHMLGLKLIGVTPP
jgi:hypothetical protein